MNKRNNGKHQKENQFPKAVLEMKNNKEKNLELKNNNTSKRNKEIKPKKKKIKKAVIIIITIVIITLGVKLAIYTHNWKMIIWIKR